MVKTTTKQILQLWKDTGWSDVKEISPLAVSIWRHFDEEVLKATMESVLFRFQQGKLRITDETSIYRYITAIVKKNAEKLEEIKQEMAAASQEVGDESRL